MHIELDAGQRRLRDEIREFLAAELPQDLATRVRYGQSISKEDQIRWTRILHARGWAAPHWPREHGGTGWSLIQRHIFDVECRAFQAPVLSGFGFNMVGPAIIRHGSAEQKAEFLPKILSAELWWCQGYSEPQAGSDLASLRMRAVREGDEYVVTGQKIWTSGAEIADWIFCLVRTDPTVQMQRGISFLLIDLNSPGISIEPLYAFNGKRLWNQVFFDSVRVPIAQRLGDEDKGWTVAKSLLGDERLMVSRVAENKRLLNRLRDVLGREQEGTRPLDQTTSIRRRLSELDIRLQALEMTSLRLLSEADKGGQVGAEPSMLKLKGSQLVQAMDELLCEAIGHWALPLDGGSTGSSVGPASAEYIASGLFHHRGYSIAGGSSEVQHNIVAKQVLGL